MQNQYLVKQSGKQTAGVAKGVLTDILAGLGLGGTVAAESGAAFRGDKSLFRGDITDPATLRIFSEPDTLRDFLVGGVFGTGLAHKARAAGGGTAGAIVGGLGGGAAEVAVTNFVSSQFDANKLKAQELAQEKNINDIKTAVVGTLGLGALGLGGYALYKYLRDKKEERSAPPKVKVRIKGNSRDPYDDATVEVPLHNLKVTENLERGVNRSMRRVIRDNNIFSSKKKDPFTGKLISYEEYTTKYGDPKQKNKKKTFTDGSIPFISNSAPQLDTKPTVDAETDYIDPITSYEQNNESI